MQNSCSEEMFLNTNLRLQDEVAHMVFFFIVAQFYVLLRVFQVNVIAPSHKATKNWEVTAPREKEVAGSDEGGRNGRWRSAKKQG